MAVEAKRHRFTVDEYEAMDRAGILGADDCVAPAAFPETTVAVADVLG